METRLIKVNPRQPRRDKIHAAAEIIERGGVVAFPTETVYGLGANALNPGAVEKIFEAKGRPADNPLIVHIARKKGVYELAEEVSDKAEELMDRYWPGPLTLILRKSEIVPEITTGGLDTVAIRMPDHCVALSLISEAKVPIAAPSANISGTPSPTTAKHVMKDLNGRIDAILDGGPTRIGVESTVIDLTSDPPTILRPGGVTLEELQSVRGDIELRPTCAKIRKGVKMKARSPGMKYRHYAPEAELILVEGDFNVVAREIQEIADASKKDGKRVGIIATEESAVRYKAEILKVIGSRNDLATVARNLFETLRMLDERGVDVIIAEGFGSKGLGLCVMDRLRKAADRVVQI